jgi:hypothetical protein
VFHRPLRRPLAAVAVLSLADYLLWNWSLAGGHDILALIAGLTLVPLLIALLWLLAVAGTRLLAELTRRARARSAANTAARRAGRRAGSSSAGPLRATGQARSARERHAAASAGAGEAPSAASPSSKLAA